MSLRNLIFAKKPTQQPTYTQEHTMKDMQVLEQKKGQEQKKKEAQKQKTEQVQKQPQNYIQEKDPEKPPLLKKKHIKNAENKMLRSIFSHVFKKLQELPQMDFSQLNSHHPKTDINNMKEKLKKLSPPQHYSRLASELFGLGPIEDLIQDRNNSEIVINGKNHIFYEQKGKLYLLQDTFLSDLTFYNFIHRILESAKVTLDLKQPFVDGNWNGWRIHIAREPVVSVDFHLSFRRHPKKPWTFPQLKNSRVGTGKSHSIN